VSLSFESYLDTISEDAARLADSRVPFGTPIPGWPRTDAGTLIDHVRAVLTAARQSLLGDDPLWADAEAVEDETDDESFCAADLEITAATIVTACAVRGAAAELPNWTGRDETVGFLARRLACDLALHRGDLERAEGRERPVERELALDGIEERLGVHLGRHVDLGIDSLGGSLGLVCSDDPAGFLIEVTRGRLSYRVRRGPADVIVRASASDLLAFVWGRIDPGTLSVTGSRAVAEAFRNLPGEGG
jgi:uncharacterized protein (TIGR03083 family)